MIRLETVETNIGGDDQVHHQDREKLSAYEMALKTWSDWLHNHVNPTQTRLFFVSLSPTHLRYIYTFHLHCIYFFNISATNFF